jgi:hypothetical protein
MSLLKGKWLCLALLFSLELIIDYRNALRLLEEYFLCGLASLSELVCRVACRVSLFGMHECMVHVYGCNLY